MKSCCIILAAGRGQRANGAGNKMYLPLAGHTPLYYTLRQVKRAGCFDCFVVVTGRGEQPLAAAEAAKAGISAMYACGGDTRQESAYAGILAVPEDTQVIAMHDGARPFASAALFNACVQSCMQNGSGVAGKRMTDTVKKVNGEGVFLKTVDRSDLATVQTPQVFFKSELKQAYEKAIAEGFEGTDDASLMERIGHNIYLVDMPEDNFKLTHAADFEKAERLLQTMPIYKVGQGYDIHSFVAGRPLLLAGVHIPHEKGLLGHSDADVLAHAAIDALLGAAGLGDIGELFPDTDAAYKNADSMALLQIVIQKISEAGYVVQNLDATVFLEKPKLSAYKIKIAAALAKELNIAKDCVNVKAKTAEGHGAVGQGEAAAAAVTCLLYKKEETLWH